MMARTSVFLVMIRMIIFIMMIKLMMMIILMMIVGSSVAIIWQAAVPSVRSYDHTIHIMIKMTTMSMTMTTMATMMQTRWIDQFCGSPLPTSSPQRRQEWHSEKPLAMQCNANTILDTNTQIQMQIQIHKFNRRQRTYLIQSNLNRDRNDTQRNFSIAMQIQIQANTSKDKQIQTNTNKYNQIVHHQKPWN